MSACCHRTPACNDCVDPAPRLLVYLESPFRGDVNKHRAYLALAMRDSLKRGEAPFASHGLYTYCLDEDTERDMGIESGLAWGKHAALTVVYQDLGITPGMRVGIDRATAEGRRIEFRSLPGWQRYTEEEE